MEIKNLVAAIAVSAVALACAAEDSFGFASWNIGHFALGRKYGSTISESEAPRKIVEYKAFLDKADAKVIGICEHEGFVDSNNTFAVEKTILPGCVGKAVGQSGIHRLNALYWKDAECVKSGAIKFEKHSQYRYYRYARLKIAGREVCFVMTHLDWNHFKPGHEHDRESQIARLVADFKDEPYVVIGGDFNTCVKGAKGWKDAPEEYEPFRKAGFSAAHWGELKTCPATKPVKSIDNIFVKGFTVSDVRVQVDPTLSDHALIRCTLAFQRTDNP
jgi:endonuclease/exonuclease/phosphatase family metal-dependent hydrolase